MRLRGVNIRQSDNVELFLQMADPGDSNGGSESAVASHIRLRPRRFPVPVEEFQPAVIVLFLMSFTEIRTPKLSPTVFG